ncbi:MAG: hypothetical protein ABIS86_21850 [Streptosporangiaceae bacterium]
MTTPGHDHGHDLGRPETTKPDRHGGHGGHGWMMIACCVPMLVIAVVLVATGVVGFGFVFVAIMCTAMMALMMRGMGGEG